jgi:hypothetical protein
VGFNIFNRKSIIIKSKFIFIPLRLLSWAGQQIEPYGIDFILNKLGFSHARTTIPKWLQRGFMDPLDKLQSLFIMQLLLIVEENKNQEEAENSKKHEQKK